MGVGGGGSNAVNHMFHEEFMMSLSLCVIPTIKRCRPLLSSGKYSSDRKQLADWVQEINLKLHEKLQKKASTTLRSCLAMARVWRLSLQVWVVVQHRGCTCYSSYSKRDEYLTIGVLLFHLDLKDLLKYCKH